MLYNIVMTNIKLNDNQFRFLMSFFVEETGPASHHTIATKLIRDGICIVAGDGKIWEGGIGNFINIRSADHAINCSELTFDLAYFLSSEWFKSGLTNKMQIVKSDLDSAQKNYNDIYDLWSVAKLNP